MNRFFIVFILLLSALQLFADSGEKQILAVMEFEDLSGKLPPEMLSGATEYIRSEFVNSNKFVVIAKERQEKAMIAEMKKESYKACNDKNCQIPLGQALSADTILRTTISFFGGAYTITSELIDLAKEATVIGAKQEYDGTETSLKHALDKIVERISKYSELNAEEKIEEKPAVVPAAPAEKIEEEKSEKVAENVSEPQPKETVTPAEPAKEKPVKEKTPSNTWHPYKTAGISLMVAGAVVAAAGIASFHVLSDKEYKKYKDMEGTLDVHKAVAEGLSFDEYYDPAKKHYENSNIYRYLEITSGVVGGALLVTGVVLTVIKKEKPDAKVSLSNISVVPSENGFYASAGFNF